MRWAIALLCAACSNPGPYAPAPGSKLVLELGNTFGVAWSPLWCREPVAGVQSCARLFPDSSQATLVWDEWRRPIQFTRGWNRISPIRAFDVRDSLKRDLGSRGARWIETRPSSADQSRHVRREETKWCLDSAVVMLSQSWQEGASVEFVGLLVGAIPDRDCSPDVFRAAYPQDTSRRRASSGSQLSPLACPIPVATARAPAPLPRARRCWPVSG